jgi:quercetin dioxygenase-like cupin family protein
MQSNFFPYGEYPKTGHDGDGPSRRLLAFGGSLMLAEMDFEEGSVSEAHSHEAEQLTYCRSGEFECSVGGEMKTLSPGDSFYAGPLVPHGARCLKAGRLLHVFSPQREDYKGS